MTPMVSEKYVNEDCKESRLEREWIFAASGAVGCMNFLKIDGYSSILVFNRPSLVNDHFTVVGQLELQETGSIYRNVTIKR